ncbi:cyclopropane-fatty-acyl-phospholipid synthase family protein [Dyadobacter sp. 3J3]|uniref:SAM-dependent methyltransferase n=1 Tax=Dyadobacter sp. 3J3 TaxID=2606600 RepID=UPI00135B3A4C|nr:cyclopropane-fatty-acyl-phospholipid synthase family protein [Dyadobacter sp. 3J3]
MLRTRSELNRTQLTDTKPGLYQQLVFSQLRKMSLGQLKMMLPDGKIEFFGDGSHQVTACITITHIDFFKKLILFGDIGFGEAYVDGLWETNNITDVITWVLLNVENAPGVSGSKSQNFALNILRLLNKVTHGMRSNTLEGSRKNISEHYDLSNDFFATFLDTTMTYSGAYFRHKGMSLEDAQLEKYDRLCKKLHLQPSDHVLEIGSGWGGNAIHMAKNYGCKVTSLTLSTEQQQLATRRIEEAGLSERVQVVLMDYRHVEGQFDKIVSIEMLEAVGHQYLDVYFSKCNSLLKKDGILAIQVITCPDSRYDSLKNGVDWIQKYIFPGSLLPSVSAINQSVNKTSEMSLVDLKELGLHYAYTLNAWYGKFIERLEEIKKLGFDESFVRKWTYYLCYCEAAFASRNISVMQLVYTRPNNSNLI